MLLAVTNNTTPSHPGQINASGATDALFLKQFGGEVLVAFQQKSITDGKVLERTITGGKSAQFPVTGVAKAKYHTLGENILESNNAYLSTIKGAEKVINVDSELVASVFLSSIEEAELHFDVRSIYANELGRELARQYDIRNLQVIAKAARTASAITDTAGYRPLLGGSVINAGSTVTTDAVVFAQALFAAAQKLDEKSVDEGERYCAVSPANYNLLVQGLTAINKWYGSQGSYAEGEVIKVAGLILCKTIHLPTTVVTSDTDHEANDYSGDFTKTVALVWAKPAAGVVKLRDIRLETEYFMQYRGNLMVASYALGHGVLRPECAVEISSNANS